MKTLGLGILLLMVSLDALAWKTVPEPGTLGLLAMGLAGVGLGWRRRR